MLKECTCDPFPPDQSITSQMLEGEVCTYTATGIADTVLDLLNQYIYAGKFHVNGVAVKNIASYYFLGPLNSAPNLYLNLNETIRKKKGIFWRKWCG